MLINFYSRITQHQCAEAHMNDSNVDILKGVRDAHDADDSEKNDEGDDWISDVSPETHVLMSVLVDLEHAEPTNHIHEWCIWCMMYFYLFYIYIFIIFFL